MDHQKDQHYETGPPFSLDCNIAHIQRVLDTGTLGHSEAEWLDGNIPLFETGIYDFKANEWYPLACELAQKGIRKDLWAMCCKDFQFTFPNPFPATVKFSDPSEVRDLVTSWFHSNHNKKILPKWNPDTQELHSTASSLRIKPEHIYAVLDAFATPALAAEVRRGIAVNQFLGVEAYSQVFKEPSDTWRFASWILSPQVLGDTANPHACETFNMPDLDDTVPK